MCWCLTKFISFIMCHIFPELEGTQPAQRIGKSWYCYATAPKDRRKKKPALIKRLAVNEQITYLPLYKTNAPRYIGRLVTKIQDRAWVDEDSPTGIYRMEKDLLRGILEFLDSRADVFQLLFMSNQLRGMVLDVLLHSEPVKSCAMCPMRISASHRGRGDNSLPDDSSTQQEEEILVHCYRCKLSRCVGCLVKCAKSYCNKYCCFLCLPDGFPTCHRSGCTHHQHEMCCEHMRPKLVKCDGRDCRTFYCRNDRQCMELISSPCKGYTYYAGEHQRCGKRRCNRVQCKKDTECVECHLRQCCDCAYRKACAEAPQLQGKRCRKQTNFFK